MPGFENCVRGYVDRGEMPRDVGEDILRQFREDAANGIPRATAKERARERYDKAAALEENQKALTLAAHERIMDHARSFRDEHGRPNVIKAFMALYEDFGYSGHPSARFLSEALKGMTFAKMADALEHFRRKTLVNASLVGGRRNAGQIGDLTRAMYQEPGQSPDLMKFAADLKDGANDLRKLFNEYAGGEVIPELADWNAPQSYDRNAVFNAGGHSNNRNLAFERFFKDMDPEFAWTKMRDPITQEVFQETPPEDKRRRIMDEIWRSIVTNDRVRVEPSSGGQGTSIANSRADHRYIVYKDADSYMRAMRKYGNGDSLSAMIHHVESMSKDIALMKLFGPNPRATHEWMKQVMIHEAAKRVDGQPSLLPGTNRRGVISGLPVPFRKAQIAGKILDGYLEQFRGNGTEQSATQLLGSTLRNHAYGALLGSSVWTHIGTNWAIQMHARALSGVPIFQAIPHIIRAFGGNSRAEYLRAGLSLQDGLDVISQRATELGRFEKYARFSRWWPDRVTRISGLTAILEANRRSFLGDNMARIADLKNTDWANLPTRLKEKLVGYGMDERDWKLIQTSLNYLPMVGSAPWTRHIEIQDVAERDPEAVLRLFGQTDLAQHTGPGGTLSDAGLKKAWDLAFQTAWKYQGYLLGQQEVAVPGRTMAFKARMSRFTGGTRAAGEMAQIITSPLFAKGFIASFSQTAFKGMYHEWRRNPALGLADFACLAAILTLGGTIAYSLTEMFAGKDVPPLDPNDPRTLMTIFHGAMKGGTFGFMDAVLNPIIHPTSYGRGPIEGAMGPVADLFMTPFEMATAAVHHGKRENVWQAELAILLRKLRTTVPIVPSLWWTRAAFDRLYMDGVAYLTNSVRHTYARDRERALEKETGQKFWWPPGPGLPQRLPGFTHARSSVQ